MAYRKGVFLQFCYRRLLAGKATSVCQYMPYFTSPQSRHPSTSCTFINLQINTCCFQDADGSISPALFLWYNAPSSDRELMSQLQRDYMALSHIPSMVTVFAMDGRVVHQNGKNILGFFRLCYPNCGKSLSSVGCVIQTVGSFCFQQIVLSKLWEIFGFSGLCYSDWGKSSLAQYSEAKHMCLPPC